VSSTNKSSSLATSEIKIYTTIIQLPIISCTRLPSRCCSINVYPTIKPQRKTQQSGKSQRLAMAFQIPPGTDLSTIPAALPPFGVVPNFENPPTLAHVVTGVEITFMVLAAVAIGTRLITNITAKRVAGIDDGMTRTFSLRLVRSFSYSVLYSCFRWCLWIYGNFSQQ
jgi:hypothetical protein